jgi:hypothetical protein
LNDNFDSIDSYIGGNRTRLDIVETLCDELRGDVNELMAGGGTGGDTGGDTGGGSGVVPEAYVLRYSKNTVGGTDWYTEVWSTGFARCWCEYKIQSAIECNFETSDNVYYGTVQIPLPNEVFTASPFFTTVTPKGLYPVSATVGMVSGEPYTIVLVVFNTSLGTDKATTIPSNASVSFCIEVRGDCSRG